MDCATVWTEACPRAALAATCEGDSMITIKHMVEYMSGMANGVNNYFNK